MKKLNFFLTALMALSMQTMAQTVELSLDKFHFNRGEDVVVKYKNAPANEKDYIGIAPLGQEITGIPGGYTTTYAYLDNVGAKQGTSTITGHNMGATEDGYYWAVYLLNDGYDAASTYVPFYYGEKKEVSAAPELALEECTVEYTTVTFTDNEQWRLLVNAIEVDGTPLVADDYTMEAGALYILKDLTAAKSLTIKSWDHTDAVLALNNSTSIDEVSAEVSAVVEGNQLQIAGVGVNAVSVYSIAGSQVGTYAIAEACTLDLSHFDDGVYLVNLKGKGINKVIKIVVKH